MIKNKYKHISLNQAERNVLNINRFGGLDLSNQRFNVASSRAIDEQNFYLKDGVIQVREGFEELYDVHPFEFIERDFKTGLKNSEVITVNPVNFNGIWSFEGEDNKRHIVAHIGYLLYEIKDFGTKNMSFEVLSNDNDNDTAQSGDETVTRRLLFRFQNFRSFAFVGAKKLWFLGGNQYMLIRFKNDGVSIQPVEDNEITFIPKTAISIAYTNAKASQRAELDYPNMLTMYRRNTLISGVGKVDDALQETPYFEYVLDAPLLTKENAGNTTELSKIHLILRERGQI